MNKKRLGNELNVSCERKCVKDDSNVSGFGEYVLPSAKTWNSEESTSFDATVTEGFFMTTLEAESLFSLCPQLLTCLLKGVH